MKISLVTRTFAVVSCFTLLGTACSHKKVKADEPVVNAGDNDPNTSDLGRAMGLQTLHFAYDTFLLDPESKKILDQNASILKDHTSLKIQIEGHCDERGGIQYNLALGEKRANSAKRYLIKHGIAEKRIETISYGKERPLVTGDTEEVRAKNRRDNFVITAK